MLEKNKPRGENKLAAMIDDKSFWDKAGDGKQKAYDLDEFGWNCCVVNGGGGIAININDDHDVVLLDINQLKTLLDHAENVEETMNELNK